MLTSAYLVLSSTYLTYLTLTQRITNAIMASDHMWKTELCRFYYHEDSGERWPCNMNDRSP